MALPEYDRTFTEQFIAETENVSSDSATGIYLTQCKILRDEVRAAKSVD